MTRRLRSFLVTLAAWAATSAAPAAAQPAGQPLPRNAPGAQAALPAAREDGSALTVYLLTFGQGDEVWERFGHNAIWIRDAARGTSVAYNWGMFDFAQPNFVGRFLTGDTRYWMEGDDAAEMVRVYAGLDRSVWAQELALTPAERLALRDFVEWNARPENKFYRYDYYRDNCSTRVRDAIDRVLGGQIRTATAGDTTSGTYRWQTRRLVAGDFPIYTGIQIALGRPADRPITAWEEMFLPVKMMERMRTLRVADGAGGTVPLVKSERQIYAAERPPERQAPPNTLPLYLGLGLGVAALVAALGAVAARGNRAARVVLGGVGGTWSLLAGVLGTAELLAWTVTRHVFMYRNESLLQLEPLSLALAVLVPMALWSGRGARAARRLAYVVAAAAVVGLLAKLLPVRPEHNGDVIALALPVHLALAWSLWRVASARASASHDSSAREATPAVSAAPGLRARSAP